MYKYNLPHAQRRHHALLCLSGGCGCRCRQARAEDAKAKLVCSSARRRRRRTNNDDHLPAGSQPTSRRTDGVRVVRRRHTGRCRILAISAPLGHPLRLDMTPARRLCPLMRSGAGGYAHLAFSIIKNGYNGFGDVSTEDDLRSEIPRRNNHRGLNARSQAQSVSRRTDANGQVEHSFQGNRDPKFLHSQPSLLTPFGLGGSPISRFLSRSFFWQHF